MTTDYLQTAFELADSLRLSASMKAADTSGGAMLTSGTFGFDHGHSKLTKHKEQYAHFTGWTYTAISRIAQKIAGQTLCVGRLSTRPTRRKLALPGCLKSMGDKIEPLESHPLLVALADP